MLELNGTIIAVILNFIILIWMLNKFLYKPVQETLLKRKNFIESSLTEASQKEREAAELKNKYEEQIGQAKSEAHSIVNKASALVEKMKLESFESAKADAHFIREKAEKEAVEIKNNAVLSAKKDIAAIACAIAGKFMKKNIDAGTHKVLIDDMVSKIDRINLN